MNYPSTNEAAASVLGAVAAPSRRYWFTLYGEGHNDVVDIRPCMIGPGVRAGKLFSFARYYLIGTQSAQYVEITADSTKGVPRPILAIAWFPTWPHGAANRRMGIDTHVTREGLGLV